MLWELVVSFLRVYGYACLAATVALIACGLIHYLGHRGIAPTDCFEAVDPEDPYEE